ncbi:MAG TPA: SagB/ThcOx family dehydrogenase [Gemmataceae bacterium]|nr:SagB/ThcOx family dehydrogenase [Gemmataceae bacterium]
MSADIFFRRTELDRSTFPAWRDAILEAEAGGAALPMPPRSYPGYPRWPLLRVRPRWWPSLDGVLARRRCVYPLGTLLPSRRKLSRLLQTSHGITGAADRGPVPSAGGLQALELYLAVLSPDWLPGGFYHYDRSGHHLSQLFTIGRGDLQPLLPSLERIEGGAFLWLLVGDGARVCGKYAERGLRFLLLEAGHLMQNLCLVSASLGLATVPLGGFFERPLARRLMLPPSDEVLYAGICG